MSATVDPFQLGGIHDRQPYTKASVKRGETTHIQCKADAFLVRRVDEIVASRIDDAFKTRSDVLQDAIAMWVDDWDEHHPDGASGQLSYQSELSRLERASENRTAFLTRADTQLNRLSGEGDRNGLQTYLEVMARARGDFLDDAPKSFINKMDQYIDQAKRLLSAD